MLGAVAGSGGQTLLSAPHGSIVQRRKAMEPVPMLIGRAEPSGTLALAVELLVNVVQGAICMGVADFAASRRAAWGRVLGLAVVLFVGLNSFLSLADLALIGDALPGGLPTPQAIDPTRVFAVIEYGVTILALAGGWIVGAYARQARGNVRRVSSFVALWYATTLAVWLGGLFVAHQLVGADLIRRVRVQLFWTAILFAFAVPYGLRQGVRRAADHQASEG